MRSARAEPSCPTGRCSPSRAATMGEAVQIERASPCSCMRADVNPDLDEVERLELVVHGKVVAATNGPGRVEVEHRLMPGRRMLGRRSGSRLEQERRALGSGVRDRWRRRAHVARAIRSRHRGPVEARSRPHREHTRISWSRTSRRDVEASYYLDGWKCCPSSRYGLTRQSTAMSASAPWHRQVARGRGREGRDRRDDPSWLEGPRRPRSRNLPVAR